jgi:hypothetical protein
VGGESLFPFAFCVKHEQWVLFFVKFSCVDGDETHWVGVDLLYLGVMFYFIFGVFNSIQI